MAPEDRGTGEIFREVEPEDLLKYGLIPEFVGRLPVVATLEDLDEPSLKLILTQPKNALVKQYQRLFEMERVNLTLAEEALRAIARKAIDRKTGARGLRSIMEGILLDTMFDLPSLEGVEEVVISREVVEGTGRPLYIRDTRGLGALARGRGAGVPGACGCAGEGAGLPHRARRDRGCAGWAWGCCAGCGDCARGVRLLALKVLLRDHSQLLLRQVNEVTTGINVHHKAGLDANDFDEQVRAALAGRPGRRVGVVGATRTRSTCSGRNPVTTTPKQNYRYRPG